MDLESLERGQLISKAGMEIHRQQSFISLLIPGSQDLRRALTVAAVAAKHNIRRLEGKKTQGTCSVAQLRSAPRHSEITDMTMTAAGFQQVVPHKPNAIRN